MTDKASIEFFRRIIGMAIFAFSFSIGVLDLYGAVYISLKHPASADIGFAAFLTTIFVGVAALLSYVALMGYYIAFKWDEI